MSNDTSGDMQMSDNNDDVQDGVAMKKELGLQGIEIEEGGSRSEDENGDEEEDEQISTDDDME